MFSSPHEKCRCCSESLVAPGLRIDGDHRQHALVERLQQRGVMVGPGFRDSPLLAYVFMASPAGVSSQRNIVRAQRAVQRLSGHMKAPACHCGHASDGWMQVAQKIFNGWYDAVAARMNTYAGHCVMQTACS